MANISIVGLGPVGLASGVAFATQGHRVAAMDIDVGRSTQVARGESPFYEKGLGAALKKVLRQGRFTVADSMEDALRASTIVFVCVGTPSRSDGTMDDGPIREATKSIAHAWVDQKRRTVVVKSTVLPGTTESVLRPILKAAGWPFRLAVNPEFLREGRALDGALRPDRIVLGVDETTTARTLRTLYHSAECPVLVTNIQTAETIKYATNAFLATKVAFANELANLCQALGVSYDEVHRGLSLDPRINPRFLVPGVGFGGSCFPKDLRALMAAAHVHGAGAPLLSAVLEQNDAQYMHAVDLLQQELGDLKDKRIAVLGLAFKGETDDVRESRAVPIAQALLAKGAAVVGYDPVAGPGFSSRVPEVTIANTIREALTGAHGVIVQADWPEFSHLTAKDFTSTMAAPVVVDGRRILDIKEMKGVRFRRIG